MQPPKPSYKHYGCKPQKHEMSLPSRAKQSIRVKCPDHKKLGITPTPSLTGGQVPKVQLGNKSLSHRSKPTGWSHKPKITNTNTKKQFILRLHGTAWYMTQRNQSIKYYQSLAKDKLIPETGITNYVQPTGNTANHTTACVLQAWPPYSWTAVSNLTPCLSNTQAPVGTNYTQIFQSQARHKTTHNHGLTVEPITLSGMPAEETI